MSTNIPCLNPACAHVFSQREIAGAAALQCPRCGTVIQLRSGGVVPGLGAGPPPAAPRPAGPPYAPTPLAKPVSPIAPGYPSAPVPTARPPMAPAASPPPAVARPVAPLPAQPLNQPAFDPAFELPPPAPPPGLPGFEASATALGPMVSRQQPKKSNLYGKILGTLAVLILMGGVATSIYLLATREREKTVHKPGAIEGRFQSLSNSEELAFVVTVPKAVWQKDGLIRSRLGATVAMARTGPDAFFAVSLKDYGQYKPRDAELLREGIKRLEALFSDGLELSPKAEKAQLADKPAQRLEFRGQLKTVFWSGELYLLAYQGIAYWFVIAAPHLKDAQDELKTLTEEKSFVIQTQRHGWTEQPVKLDIFKGERLPLQMHAYLGVWEQFKARDEDERADLVLFGRYVKDNEKDNRKNASVLVLTLEPQPGLKEGIKAAFEDLEKKKQGEIEGSTIQPAEEKTDPLNDSGPPIDIGNRRGKIVEFRVVGDDKPKRYVMMAIIVEDERLLVVRCECIWEHRQIWRQDFLDLLQTLKVKSG